MDARLIAASNRPLADLVQQGAFREDLYHRLDLLRLALPPLRERGTDIVALARHLLARIAARHRLAGLTITPAGEARLLAQPWRGNVRELAHEIERAVIFSGGAALDFAHLAGPAAAPAGGWRNPAWRLPAAGFSIDALVNELIAEALRGNRQQRLRRRAPPRRHARVYPLPAVAAEIRRVSQPVPVMERFQNVIAGLCWAGLTKQIQLDRHGPFCWPSRTGLAMTKLVKGTIRLVASHQ